MVVVKRLPKLELPDGNHDAVRRISNGARLEVGNAPCTASYLLSSRSSPETRSSATEAGGSAAHHVLLELVSLSGSEAISYTLRAAAEAEAQIAPLAPEDTGVLPRDADVDRTSLVCEKMGTRLYRHPLGSAQGRRR